MKYTARPGIVMTKICNQIVLIPTHEAAKICPTVTALSFFHALVYKRVAKQEDPFALVRMFSAFQACPEEEAAKRIQAILDELTDKKYLIKEE